MLGLGLGIGRGFRGGGGVAAPLDPLTLSPFAWFDASDTSSITSSGGNVSQWNDKSGNARHATQATGANQPVTASATMNGLNVLQFNSLGGMTLPAAFQALPSTSHTVFIVSRETTTGATGRLIFNMASSGAGRSQLFKDFSTSGNLTYRSGGTPSNAVQTYAQDTVSHILSAGQRPHLMRW